MPDGTPPTSRPPSDPRPLPSRGGADWGADKGPYDSPARLQMLAVVVLGLLLVSVPLYLWRRPRSGPDANVVDGGPDDAGVAVTAAPVVAEEPDAAWMKGLRIGEARVLECHDSGSKKTPSEQCDALPPFAKAFGEAIVAAKDCIPQSAGPGSITYVADVSFAKRRLPIAVSLPKDGRSYKGLKVVGSCAAAVRSTVSGMSLEGMQHAHSRYKIAIIAQYPGADGGGG